MRIIPLLLALLATPLSGCMTAAAIHQARLDAVDASDFAWAMGEGPATLEGRALTDEALLAGAACQQVELRPAGFGVELGRNRGLESIRPSGVRIGKTFRYAPCDASGRFRFERVPAGRYYVVAELPTEYTYSNGTRASEWAWKEIRLASGSNSMELRRVCEVLLRWDTPYNPSPATTCDVAPLRIPKGSSRAVNAKNRKIVADFLAQKPARP